jgi:hypothetical protein
VRTQDFPDFWVLGGSGTTRKLVRTKRLVSEWPTVENDLIRCLSFCPEMSSASITSADHILNELRFLDKLRATGLARRVWMICELIFDYVCRRIDGRYLPVLYEVRPWATGFLIHRARCLPCHSYAECFSLMRP